MWDYQEYVKEIQGKIDEENRQRLIEHNKKVMQEVEEYEMKQVVVREQRRIATENSIKEKRMRGEIISPFIKKHLEEQIKAARWVLVMGMAITLLFKGFWAIWIVLIVIYIYQVRKYKREAVEADLFPWEKEETKGK